jgi:peroxiredoxin Q/BCP
MAAKKKSKAKPVQAKPKAKAKAAKQPAKKARAEAKAKPAKAKAKAKVTLPAKLKKKPAKTAAKVEAKVKATAPKLVKAIKRAAQKVVKVAAQATAKLMDADSGKPAPEFELTDEKGEKVSSSTLAGKPYLLYFYPKDDTPGCTKEACDIRDNFGRFGQQGLRVLGVSPDSTASHAKFGKKYGLPFTLLSDPEKTLANAYGVWGMKQNYGKEYMGIIRSTFLVGADGLIKKSYRGVKVDGHVDAILQDAQALL